MRALLPVAIAALLLSGCGRGGTYTFQAYFAPGHVYVQISGPPDASRSVAKRFQASFSHSSRWIHDAVFIGSQSQPVGPSDCAVSAGGGKVTITVFGSKGIRPSLCSAITRRF